MNIRLLAALALLCSSTLMRGQQTIKLDSYRNTVAMHANVGGRDGFFVFDTGGGISIITPEFAKEIGCEPWGRLTGYAMMGNRMDSPKCDDIAVTIGGRKFNSQTTGVFDVMKFYPPDAQRLDGLIALNIFEGKAITIDFPAQTLTIETSESMRRRIRGATEVPMRLTREVQGGALAVSVGVPVARGHVWMELDSGNSRTNLISKPYAALFGLDPADKNAQKIDFPLAGPLRVRGQAFTPDMIIDGNIGMPFLKDAVVTIDFAASRLWIRMVEAK